MAQISIPIKVDGIDCIIRVIKDVVDEANFKEDVSDDYKNGVYDFSNALIKTLETLKDDDYVQHGHWICENLGFGAYRYRCSECGNLYGQDQIEDFEHNKFCGDCGARTDGEEE